MKAITTERMQRPFTHKSLDQERSTVDGWFHVIVLSFLQCCRSVTAKASSPQVLQLSANLLSWNPATPGQLTNPSKLLIITYGAYNDVSQENNGSYLTRLADLCSLSLYCIFQLI